MLSFNCTVYVDPKHGRKIQIINRGYNLLHIMWSIYEIIHFWTAVVDEKWRMIIEVNFPI